MKKEHFEIILEEMNSKISNIAEGLQVLDNKIERIDGKLDKTAKEIRDELAVRFDYLDRKIDSVEDRLNKKIDSVEDRLNKKIDSGISELKYEIRQTNNILTNHEKRITKIEEKVGA